jgi:predicted Zn-dependent peptidase
LRHSFAVLLRSISQDQLRKYIRDNYIAPRIALVAAGGIDHDYLVDLAERKLNGVPPMRTPRNALSRVSEGLHSQTLHPRYAM